MQSYGVLWGDIKGTLSDQADLEARLLADESSISGAAKTALWGSITGQISAQTDLQSALTTAGSTAAWGAITGTLTSQTDLNTRLTDIDAAVADAAKTAQWGKLTGNIKTQTDLYALIEQLILAKSTPIFSLGAKTALAYRPGAFSSTFPAFIYLEDIPSNILLRNSCFFGVEELIQATTDFSMTADFSQVVGQKNCQLIVYLFKSLASDKLITLTFYFMCDEYDMAKKILTCYYYFDGPDTPYTTITVDESILSDYKNTFPSQAGNITITSNPNNWIPPMQLSSIFNAFCFNGLF